MAKDARVDAIDKFDLSVIRERRRRGEKVRFKDVAVGASGDVSVVVDGGNAEVQRSDLARVSVTEEGSARLIDCDAAEIYVASGSTVEITDSSVEHIRSVRSIVTLRRSAVRPVWKDNKLHYHPPGISIEEGSTLQLLDDSEVDVSSRNNLSGSAEGRALVAKDSRVEVDGGKVLGLRAAAITQVGGSAALRNAEIVRHPTASELSMEASGEATVDSVETSFVGRVSVGDARATFTNTSFKGGLTASNAVVVLADCNVTTGSVDVDERTDLSWSGGNLNKGLEVAGQDVCVDVTGVVVGGSSRVDAVGVLKLTNCEFRGALSVAGDLDVTMTRVHAGAMTLASAAMVHDSTTRNVIVGPVDVEMSNSQVSGHIEVGDGGHATLSRCGFKSGTLAVRGGGRATVRDCEFDEVTAKGDGPNDAGLVVAERGALEMIGGAVRSPAQIKAPMLRLTRAAKEKAARLAGLGGARVLSVHTGGRARFEHVEFSDLGSDPVLLASGSEVRFEDCTLDGSSWQPGRWPRRPD